MFQKLFRREQRTNRVIVELLYATIVAAARRAYPYAQWNIPDTPLGRFEMIGLHMLLVQNRLRGGGVSAQGVAQALIDEFFKEVEHSIRELGIGDLGVPKRMKTLARMFYGRAGTYTAAILAQDRTALAAALSRNIWPGDSLIGNADALAGYGLAATRSLESQPIDHICSGRLAFPEFEATYGQASP